MAKRKKPRGVINMVEQVTLLLPKALAKDLASDAAVVGISQADLATLLVERGLTAIREAAQQAAETGIAAQRKAAADATALLEARLRGEG